MSAATSMTDLTHILGLMYFTKGTQTLFLMPRYRSAWDATMRFFILMFSSRAWGTKISIFLYLRPFQDAFDIADPGGRQNARHREPSKYGKPHRESPSSPGQSWITHCACSLRHCSPPFSSPELRSFQCHGRECALLVVENQLLVHDCVQKGE